MEEYYQHHLLLIEGIYLLLKDVVRKDDIIQSTRLPNHYCYIFPALYGKLAVAYSTSSINIHRSAIHDLECPRFAPFATSCRESRTTMGPFLFSI